MTYTPQAPEYYDEIQSHIQAQNLAAEQSGGASKQAGSGGSDFWWDVGGWVLLGTVIVGAIMLSKGGAKPTSA